MASPTTAPPRPNPVPPVPGAAWELARDAFYIAVGLTVIGVRNAEERRQQAQTALDARLAPLRERLTTLRPTIELPDLTLPDLNLQGIDLRKIDLPPFRRAA